MDILGVLNFGEAALLIAIVGIVSFGGLVLAVAAIVFGLRKQQDVRSVVGIWSGCIGASIGGFIMFISDRPLPSYEQQTFFFAGASVLLGIAGVFLGARKK